MEIEKKKSLYVALSGIIAGLYIALGYLFQPINFLGIQFRIAELIVGVCIIYPIPGLIGNVIGVLILNLSSPLGPIDLFGPLVNIPALYFIILLRNYRYAQYIGGILYAIIISVYVALILNLVLGLPIWLMFLQVLISEIILATMGILIFNSIKGKIPEIFYSRKKEREMLISRN